MTRFRRQSFAFRQTGFTLIELLVTVGIIVLLMSLITPVVMMARKSALRTKLTADFATIGQGLEEYKKDHGDYPRVDLPNTGFAVLGKALLGVYGDGVLPTVGSPPDPNDPPTYTAGTVYKAGDAVQSGGNKYVAMVETGNVPTVNTDWSPFNPNDLEDGLGSRLRPGGKKTPPYLQIERFRVRGCAILDSDDKPILYFPAKQVTPNLSVALPSGTGSFIGFTGYGPTVNMSLFNAADNLQFFKRIDDASDTDAVFRFAAMLGDINNNGIIDATEQAASTGPYLLWAPGSDGFYGPVTHPSTTPPTQVELGKCDDVTNFSK